MSRFRIAHIHVEIVSNSHKKPPNPKHVRVSTADTSSAKNTESIFSYDSGETQTPNKNRQARGSWKDVEVSKGEVREPKRISGAFFSSSSSCSSSAPVGRSRAKPTSTRSTPRSRPCLGKWPSHGGSRRSLLRFAAEVQSQAAIKVASC